MEAENYELDLLTYNDYLKYVKFNCLICGRALSSGILCPTLSFTFLLYLLW